MFNLILEKNLVCCMSMITGYMNHWDVEDAEDVVEKSVEKCVVA